MKFRTANIIKMVVPPNVICDRTLLKRGGSVNVGRLASTDFPSEYHAPKLEAAMDIYEELQALLKALHDDGISYALCGGLALAVYGITRATEDIDLLVDETSLPGFRALGQRLGFRFNPTPLILSDGMIKIHRLFKTAGEDLLVLDLLLVTAATEPAWRTRHQVQTDFGPVYVVSPEGLIHLKALRLSGQDEDDIRRLKELSDES